MGVPSHIEISGSTVRPRRSLFNDLASLPNRFVTMAAIAAARGYFAALREVASEMPLRSVEVTAKLAAARWLDGLGPDAFFLFDLHNRPSHTWRDYVAPGLRGTQVLNIVNAKRRRPWTTTDKLATTDRLRRQGVPCAPVAAVAGRTDHRFELSDSYRALADPAALAAYLDSPECPDRLFTKPAWGQKGQGAIAAARTPAGWQVGAETLSSTALAERLLASSDAFGRMLQPMIANHPAVEAITGDVGLSTLRFVTAVTDAGPRVVVVSQKLIGRPSLADNFLGGVTGNLVAPVDLHSGRLGPAYGRRQGHRFLLTRYLAHPITQRPIDGVVLPEWNATCSLALQAAAALQDEPFLGFDIALTHAGPCVLEANNVWSWVLPQITAGQGGLALFGDVIRRLAVPREDRLAALALLQDS
jgi:hypothetical protein